MLSSIYLNDGRLMMKVEASIHCHADFDLLACWTKLVNVHGHQHQLWQRWHTASTLLGLKAIKP